MLNRLLSIFLLGWALLGGSGPVMATPPQPSAAPPATTVPIVEYYNANLRHYFITGNPAEMAALDNGTLRGWTRTGYQFDAPAESPVAVGQNSVCRYYGRPEAGLDSHFYSASPEECAAVGKKFASSWALESANVFKAHLPDTASGACPAGTMPVYRLFNNRFDANHRYTTNAAVRLAMLAAGFIAEGYGPSFVAFCVPVPKPPAGTSASFDVSAITPDNFDFAAKATYASSSEAASTYTWDFGDGSTATGATVSHRYTASGTFTVVLTVKGTKNSVAVAVKGVTATVTTIAEPPSASITVIGISPDTFDFNSVATASTGAAIVGHAWNFGDGATGNGPTSSHKYVQSGTYTVVLTVTDDKSKSATASKTVAATVAAAGGPPTATISAAMVTADTYKLDAIASTPNGVTVNSYTWNFGDGSSATGASVTHKYSASGSYIVSLTVKDSRGMMTTATRNIIVEIPTVTTAPPLPPTPPVAPPLPPAPPPTVGAPGTWTQYATSYSAGTEAEYQSWYNLAYDTKRDVFYGVSWGGEIASFSHPAGRWTKLSPNINGGVHNRVTAYDPINDRVWLGSGTGSTLVGVNYFDPNTKQWINHPMTGASPGTQSTMIFDPAGKRFIVFGGWNRLGVHTWSVSPPASAMVSANVPPGPTWDGGIAPDAKKMTHWRSALDTARSRIVYVDTDGTLWALPLTLTGWQHLTPTGTPPPAMTQYVYDAANDALVGWSASPRVAGGDTVPGTTRETWLLPFSTMVWTKAASFSSGQTVPVDTVYVGYAMGYDPVRRQTMLHSLPGTGNYDPSTWAYRYPSGTDAPAPPTPPHRSHRRRHRPLLRRRRRRHRPRRRRRRHRPDAAGPATADGNTGDSLRRQDHQLCASGTCEIGALLLAGVKQAHQHGQRWPANLRLGRRLDAFGNRRHLEHEPRRRHLAAGRRRAGLPDATRPARAPGWCRLRMVSQARQVRALAGRLFRL